MDSGEELGSLIDVTETQIAATLRTIATHSTTVAGILTRLEADGLRDGDIAGNDGASVLERHLRGLCKRGLVWRFKDPGMPAKYQAARDD